MMSEDASHLHHWEVGEDRPCSRCEGDGCESCRWTGEERTRLVFEPPDARDAPSSVSEKGGPS